VLPGSTSLLLVLLPYPPIPPPHIFLSLVPPLFLLSLSADSLHSNVFSVIWHRSCQLTFWPPYSFSSLGGTDPTPIEDLFFFYKGFSPGISMKVILTSLPSPNFSENFSPLISILLCSSYTLSPHPAPIVPEYVIIWQSKAHTPLVISHFSQDCTFPPFELCFFRQRTMEYGSTSTGVFSHFDFFS